jgi:hypothetical protein
VRSTNALHLSNLMNSQAILALIARDVREQLFVFGKIAELFDRFPEVKR